MKNEEKCCNKNCKEWDIDADNNCIIFTFPETCKNYKPQEKGIITEDAVE